MHQLKLSKFSTSVAFKSIYHLKKFVYVRLIRYQVMRKVHVIFDRQIMSKLLIVLQTKSQMRVNRTIGPLVLLQ